MSKLSYTLSRNPDGTWRVEIPFNGRVSVHQTRTKDRAAAEKKAKIRIKRLPIEERAHVKYRENARAARAAAGNPVRNRGGRPRKVEAAPPAPAPAIDAAATSAKLRALPVSSDSGADEPAPSAAALPAPAENPAPAPDGESTPAPVLPELPEPAPDDPIHPEIGDDRQPDDGEAEGQEFFADVIANAVVVGTVKMCVDVAAKNGKVANEPSPKGLEWYTEGLQFRLRKLMGNASMGPNAKLFVGAGAVVLSMLWGCADAEPKPGAAPRAAPTPAPRAAPTPAAPPDRYAGGDQGGEPEFDELALATVKNGAHPRNGETSANGRFR